MRLTREQADAMKEMVDAMVEPEKPLGRNKIEAGAKVILRGREAEGRYLVLSMVRSSDGLWFAHLRYQTELFFVGNLSVSTFTTLTPGDAVWHAKHGNGVVCDDNYLAFWDWRKQWHTHHPNSIETLEIAKACIITAKGK